MIKSDYNKYKKYGGNFISIIFFTQGFWAIFQYRVANYFYRNFKISGIRQLVLALLLVWQKAIEILTGISIPASVTIGHSFYIGHFGGIILNSKTIIGNNCNISQGVTIGVSGSRENRGVPIIGNNVYIAANAIVTGKIKVEDNAVLGANSLIKNNVYKNQVVLGVPATVVSTKGSSAYI